MTTPIDLEAARAVCDAYKAELAAAKAKIEQLKHSLGMAIEAAEQQSWSTISVADRNQLNKDAMT